MSVNNNLLSVQKLFERSSIELYHGFNMRMILNDLRTKEPGDLPGCFFPVHSVEKTGE